MRVEAQFGPNPPGETLEIPWGAPDADDSYFDLRENPVALRRVQPAAENLPLRTFLTAVNSDDSFFSSARCKVWAQQDSSASAAEGSEFASRVDLMFASQPLNLHLSHYEQLARKLEELLAREGGAETMRAELCVRGCEFRALGRAGYCLRVSIFARGASPEQAKLRWGLALTRLQQALLFTSRVLRQQIAQAS